MQSLYLLGTRQISSLQADLERMGEPSSSEDRAGSHGQIVASLAALQRTIDDYDSMARREIVEEKKLKAEGRVERFREDHMALRKHFDRLKQAQAQEQAASDRSTLLGQSASIATSTSTSIPHSRFARAAPAESPFTIPNRSGTPSAQPLSGRYYARTEAALNEDSFLRSTGSMLDQYIHQGQAILGNLGTQRDALKGTQRRLLSVANTLGLSRTTITFIERRSRGDMAIFLCGAFFTLVCFGYIIKWFG